MLLRSLCLFLSAFHSTQAQQQEQQLAEHMQLAMVGEWFDPKPNRMQRGKRADYLQSQGIINHRNKEEIR